MYELWDTESANLLEAFDTEAAALAAASELISLNPAVYPAMLALASRDSSGATTWLGAGGQLAARVLATPPRQPQRSA